MSPAAAPPRRALVLALLCAAGCAQPPPEDGPPNGRLEILGPFLDVYWQRPVPAQGEAPAGFSQVEASLDPAVCGACHPEQLAQWRSSLHAGAFSPGFSGQLVEGSLARPRPLRHCQSCHAPLEEQQPVLASGEPSPRFDASLREQGIVCASCHVREHRRFGPPRRPDRPEPVGAVAHGGFEARPEFQQARFCATCHQFFDQEGPAGKPVENLFVEWRESPQAAEGRTCQSCHMPDRAHTWHGLHDPQMVRDAVEVRLHDVRVEGGRVRSALELHNRDVGHAFPSYVTPRVLLAVWQADAGGREIADTRSEGVIGRQIDFRRRPAAEVFDTRVLPGRSFRHDYDAPLDPRAASLSAEVVVDPGHHYRGVYQRLLGRYDDAHALAKIEEALRRVERARYVLERFERPLPGAGQARGAGDAGGTPAT
ncbi:MAG: multiheme c-type cytochrome [Myxococcota bacterium]